VSRSTRIHDSATRLRRAIERAVPSSGRLVAGAAELSATYRTGEIAAPIRDRAGALAYAATRMPATFAAAARALGAAADASPGFAPRTLLDVGGGSGAVAWAARAVWPSIETIVIADREPAVLELGRRLAAGSGDEALLGATWTLRAASDALEPADLVTTGYVLGELVEGGRPRAVDAAWAATLGVLAVVEPGSRAGFGRVLDARARLIDAGAHVVAPCPGPQPCPVRAAPTTWCHFLARLDRSPLQRRAKAASRSWEDEPFSYVAVARPEIVSDPSPRVVLGRPRHHPGRVELRICAHGRIETRVVSRRAGEGWRIARDLEWGDAAPSSDPARAAEPNRDGEEPEAPPAS
jgi:ribosomal protein RSM22 (predicted rRNA methylase)